MNQQGLGISTEKQIFLKDPMKGKLFTNIRMFLSQFNSCRSKPEFDKNLLCIAIWKWMNPFREKDPQQLGQTGLYQKVILHEGASYKGHTGLYQKA